jgi:hypothetical protein
MHEALCNVLATHLGSSAGRVVIEGGGHKVQRMGAPFNDRVDQLFVSASR